MQDLSRIPKEEGGEELAPAVVMKLDVEGKVGKVTSKSVIPAKSQAENAENVKFALFAANYKSPSYTHLTISDKLYKHHIFSTHPFFTKPFDFYLI